MAKYDFTKVKPVDIEGKEVKVENLHKVLADVIHKMALTRDFWEKSGAINKGQEVELNPEEVESLKKMIESPQAAFFANVKFAILDYINSVK